MKHLLPHVPKYFKTNLHTHSTISDGKLSPEECKLSFAKARDFFDKYFPDFKFERITCHSWLLDSELDKYLPEESNILAFGNLFDRVQTNESYAIIRYLFRWDITPDNIAYAVANSSLAEKVKREVMRGVKFREMLGILKEELL